MKNGELRKVPFKNYVILGVIIVITIKDKYSYNG